MRGQYPSTETIMVTSGARPNGQKKLHAPDGDGGVQCHTNGSGRINWVEKDRSVFPPGYYDLCSRCFPESGGEDGE